MKQTITNLFRSMRFFMLLAVLCVPFVAWAQFTVGDYHYDVASETDKTAFIWYLEDDATVPSTLVIPDEVTCPKGNTYKVVGIGTGGGVQHPFARKQNITKVVLGANIEWIANEAFRDCKNLKTVDFSKCTKLKEIEQLAFYKCAIEELELPARLSTIGYGAFLQNNVKKITFDGCAAAFGDDPKGIFGDLVETLVFNNPGKVISGHWGGRSLTSVTFGSANAFIADGVFEGSTSLESVTIPTGSSIGERAFANCTKLNYVSIEKGNVDASAFDGCTSLKSITLRRMPDSGWSFRGNSNIETVKLYTTDGVPDYAFYGCSNLTTVEGGLRWIGKYAFAGCSKLTSLDASLRDIDKGAFSGCTSLTTFGSCFSLQTIKEKAFENCTSLTGTLTLDYCSFIGENAFENCTNTDLVFDYIDLAVADYGAFKGCCGKFVCASESLSNYDFRYGSPLNGARFTEVEFKNLEALPKYLLYDMPELKTVICEKLTSVESLPELSVNCPLFNKLYVNNGTLKTFGSDAEGWAVYSANRRTLQYVTEGVQFLKTINGDVITLNANFAKHIKPGTGEAYCSLHMLDMTANSAQTIKLENLSAESVLPVAVRVAYGTRDRYVNVVAAGMGLITDYIKGDVNEDGEVSIKDITDGVDILNGK